LAREGEENMGNSMVGLGWWCGGWRGALGGEGWRRNSGEGLHPWESGEKRGKGAGGILTTSPSFGDDRAAKKHGGAAGHRAAELGV
jgi:hypothetical protein